MHKILLQTSFEFLQPTMWQPNKHPRVLLMVINDLISHVIKIHMDDHMNCHGIGWRILELCPLALALPFI